MGRIPACLLLPLLALLAACQGEDAPRPTTAVAMTAAVDRSPLAAIHDDAVKAMVIRRLAELDRRPYRAVAVDVQDGRVLLMGAVIKPEQRRKAEQTARGVDGVGEVLNELVLAEDKALDIFTADPAREAALRHVLGLEGHNGAVIRVINGVAFLLGSAPNAAAADAMKADASEVEGVKWVVNHLKPVAP